MEVLRLITVVIVDKNNQKFNFDMYCAVSFFSIISLISPRSLISP